MSDHAWQGIGVQPGLVFSAIMSLDTDIAFTATDSHVGHWIEDYDPRGEFNPATGEWIVGATGWYLIGVDIPVATLSAGTHAYGGFEGTGASAGAAYDTDDYRSEAAGELRHIRVSHTGKLVAGTSIFPFVNTDATVNLSVYENGHFWAIRLS